MPEPQTDPNTNDSQLDGPFSPDSFKGLGSDQRTPSDEVEPFDYDFVIDHGEHGTTFVEIKTRLNNSDAIDESVTQSAVGHPEIQTILNTGLSYQETLSNLESEVTDNTAMIESVNERINQIDHIEAKVDNIESKISTFASESDIENIEKEINQIKNEIDTHVSESEMKNEVESNTSKQINNRVVAPLLFATGLILLLAAIGAITSGSWILGLIIAPVPAFTAYYLWMSRKI